MSSLLHRIGFGTANLGADYGLMKNASLADPKSAERESHALLDAVFKSEITILDTASHYGNSEQIIGDYLQAHPERKPWVISKFLPQDWAKEAALSRKRLGSHLKALLWHNYDPQNSPKTIQPEKIQKELTAITDVQLGCSTYGTAAAVIAVESGLFKVIEIEFNLLNPHILNTIQMRAKKNGIKIVLRSILQKGFLTDAFQATEFAVHKEPKKNDILRKLGAKLVSFSKEHAMSVEELALRYAATVTKDEIILISANAKSQIATNVETLKKPALSASVLAEIERIMSQLDPTLLDLRQWKS